tara:strand:- start:102 stop:815 length:714 start_codon:yes stop_codon:yes gene_type:complete
MNFMISTKERSKQTELMDDLEMSGELLIKTLDKIASINRWLGGNRVSINGLKKLIKEHPRDKTLSIVDLGCGNGDMLREVAEFGRKKGHRFQLIGIDANQTTLDYASKLSKNYDEITFQKLDVLSEEFTTKKYDIALCTLFLHHFKDRVALNLIQSLIHTVKKGIIINDLHRSALAYYLFKLLTLFIRNEMVRNDGAISILRGFKKSDLVAFSEKIDHSSSIKWKWAFRYQWIIQKT